MSDRTIERFIRDVLGCCCPAEVFRSVSLEDNPPAFADLAPARLLRIGGRLLVLLLETDERDVLALPLEQLFIQGRQLRDAEGCNRFRLVVVTPATIHAPLLEQFTRLGLCDDHLHLHAVTAGQLPRALLSPLQREVQQ